MNRKNFIKISASLLWGFWAKVLGKTLNPGNPIQNREDMIFGWTTCLTYETADRKLGFDYFSRLLDEMHMHGMSHLIVMMASHGYYSPKNHGLAWPVSNEKLKYQLDKKAINAHQDSEFFHKIIKKAHQLNIKIFIEIKYLGLLGVEQGYPGIEFRRKRDGRITHDIRAEASDYEREAIKCLHICCDNPQAHHYMRDKISDVLQRYKTLDGILLEHPSYSGDTCYCQDTRRKLFSDTGKNLEDISLKELREWKSQRIKDTLIDLKNLVKSINPDFKYGFYSGFSPSDGDIAAFQLNRGHDTQTLNQVGFDFIMPYCEGRHKNRETEEIERIIRYMAPMDCYLHTTIRRESPHNYQLPPKGPEYIKNIITWGKQYHKQNKQFIGMTFFNEVKIPQENRKAVYDSIRE